MRTAVSFSDQGLVRKKNEDNYWVDNDRGLYLVADGMGGHDGGEIASQMAVEILVRRLSPLLDEGDAAPDRWTQALGEACGEANRKIFERASAESQLYGMGTTLTAAIVRRDRLYIAHVGDSRAYLYRDGVGRQLTEDHSLVGELLRRGGISEEEALHHPQRNVITRALGTQDEVQVDLLEEPWQRGDRLFLCTDGVTNMVSDQEIFSLLDEYGWSHGAGQQLLRLALDRGGLDNLTMIAAYESEEVGDL